MKQKNPESVMIRDFFVPSNEIKNKTASQTVEMIILFPSGVLIAVSDNTKTGCDQSLLLA